MISILTFDPTIQNLEIYRGQRESAGRSTEEARRTQIDHSVREEEKIRTALMN